VSKNIAEERGAQFEASRHIKVAIHSQFYRWMRDLVRGKVVLDAGCGSGFGTASLAKVARNVVGIDIDSGIIEQASQLYPLDNADFQVMNCQRMTFSPASFDVVVCNALFEYLDDIDAFIHEVCRVLKPGGLFVCGTKNLTLSLKNTDGLPLYRNHLQEFAPEELRSMLAEYFGQIHLYGERMKSRSESYIMDSRALGIEKMLVAFDIKNRFPKSWRKRVRKLITGVDGDKISADDFEIVEHSLDSALYIIGCGTKA
jgi:ubiquinone/menaquinone biosynthesis C-methylase UbiE